MCGVNPLSAVTESRMCEYGPCPVGDYIKIHIAENIANKTGKTMDPFQTNLTSWELRGQKVPLELEWLERASSG